MLRPRHHPRNLLQEVRKGSPRSLPQVSYRGDRRLAEEWRITHPPQKPRAQPTFIICMFHFTSPQSWPLHTPSAMLQYQLPLLHMPAATARTQPRCVTLRAWKVVCSRNPSADNVHRMHARCAVIERERCALYWLSYHADSSRDVPKISILLTSSINPTTNCLISSATSNVRALIAQVRILWVTV